MTSDGSGWPLAPAGADVILLALFQSRLRERSMYLGQLIQSQRRRLKASARPDLGAQDGGEVTLAHLRSAEAALAAVQEAEERMGLGRYGLCDSCQEPIGWDDLLASPEQTTCQGCGQVAAVQRTSLQN
ncbi:MAG: hypothetical protein ABI605_09355 [Rhizobacter sp.]